MDNKITWKKKTKQNKNKKKGNKKNLCLLTLITMFPDVAFFHSLRGLETMTQVDWEFDKREVTFYGIFTFTLKTLSGITQIKRCNYLLPLLFFIYYDCYACFI